MRPADGSEQQRVRMLFDLDSQSGVMRNVHGFNFFDARIST
jgi:hypothetical protein